MKRILKNILGTGGVAIVLALLILLAKAISMIPVRSILDLIIRYWPGILFGLGLAYLGMLVIEVFFEDEDDDKKQKKQKETKSAS